MWRPSGPPLGLRHSHVQKFPFRPLRGNNFPFLEERAKLPIGISSESPLSAANLQAAIYRNDGNMRA
jgi:hypothetical protein